jgi:hypothetical protein
MKKNILLRLFAIILSLGFMYSCGDDEETITVDENNPFPQSMTVEIPAALSDISSTKSQVTTKADGLDGHEIYIQLRVFIAFAKDGAELLQEFMDAIREHKLNRPMDINFTGEDDKRVKHLVVKENQTYEGVTYKFGLTLTDAESENEADRGIGLQIYWSGNPINGVAIIKPKNLDRTGNTMDNAIVRIDYTEASTAGYDKTMIVSLAELTLKDTAEGKFSANNIKIFVGKKGDIVDIYGNSNHPNASFSTKQTQLGLNYAFVASGNLTQDFAVSEVGLPPMSLNSTNRAVILDTNSIRKTFINAIALEYNLGVDTVEAFINKYQLMKNINPPGFFAEKKFVCSETAPDSKYNEYVTRIENMTPYNPSAISTLKINFGE